MRNGNIEQVKRLVEQGAKLDSCFSYGLYDYGGAIYLAKDREDKLMLEYLESVASGN